MERSAVYRRVALKLWPFFVEQHRLIGSYGRNRADLEATGLGRVGQAQAGDRFDLSTDRSGPMQSRGSARAKPWAK
jgi:hypothetical protein